MKEIIIKIGTVIGAAYHVSMMCLCCALNEIGVVPDDRTLLFELRHMEPLIDGIDKLYSLGCFDYYTTMEVRVIIKKLIHTLDDIRA